MEFSSVGRYANPNRRKFQFHQKQDKETIVKRLPLADIEPGSESYPSDKGGKLHLASSQAFQASGCAGASCNCGRSCCSGQCPLPPAPCIECPRVSTLNPYFNVHIFGALKLDMLFGNKRPLAPGTPYFLLPDSPSGFSQDTLDMHARQSFLGAAFPAMPDAPAGDSL
jgi:hypothetical protein